MDAVGEFAQEHVLTMTLAEELQGVYDIERLLSKVAYKSMNARDCLSLCASLQKVPKIRELLREAKSQAVEEIRDSLDTLPELTDLLTRAIHPDAPILITEGGIIRDGYSQMLDEYRAASTSGKQWILELEQKEREETGIRNLRIQYNRVFGYYIEVSKSYYEMVPARYIRKQTLANCERYMTPELKEIEQKIVGAQEQSTRLELQLFTEVREKIAEQIARIQKTAMALKSLDALLSLAKSAIEYHYVRPEMTQDGTLDIVEGRHPVVEQTMSEGGFVPNDTHMNADDCRMCIITGPNMAGKSTYMRQVALIALMAHIGSFVPAKEAKIPVTDRIFTRVGASDDLASGQSTFMVEMSETAYILRNATAKSLVILDEIGRGTSTFDGLAIAWAVVEYLCDKQNPAQRRFSRRTIMSCPSWKGISTACRTTAFPSRNTARTSFSCAKSFAAGRTSPSASTLRGWQACRTRCWCARTKFRHVWKSATSTSTALDRTSWAMPRSARTNRSTCLTIERRRLSTNCKRWM